MKLLAIPNVNDPSVFDLVEKKTEYRGIANSLGVNLDRDVF
jgi:hypothetical protein